MRFLSYLLLVVFLTPFSFFSLAKDKKKKAKTTAIVQEHALASNISTLQVHLKDVSAVFQPAPALKKGSKRKVFKIRSLKKLRTQKEKSTFQVLSEDFFKEKKQELSNSKKTAPAYTFWIPKNISLKIFAKGGKLELKGLKSPKFHLSVLDKSFIQIHRTQGDLSIFQSSGDLNIEQHKGALQVQTEKVNIQLKKYNGVMDVKSFKGGLNIHNSRGKLAVHSFKSPLIVKNFNGELNFHQERGNTTLQSVRGVLKGYADEGNVRGKITPKKAYIETGKGSVALDLPGSFSWVDLESWEGGIKTPPYFYRTRAGGISRAKGRLKGKKQGGSVSLKSRSGSLRIWQSAL